jgi:transcriptional regulator with XRE-family HTH domain
MKAPAPISELLESHNKAAVARKLGVEPSTVARWCRGEAVPSGDKLLALANLLEIDPRQISLPAKVVA